MCKFSALATIPAAIILAMLCLVLPACSGGGGGGGGPVGPIAVQVTGVNPSSTTSGVLSSFTAVLTGTAPYTYAWDFGGGATPNTSTAANPAVALGAAGTYNCTVTVNNSVGTPDTYHFTLTVIVNAGGGGGGTFPSDPTQLAWVTTWYTTLPVLFSSTRVFEDGAHRDRANDVLAEMNSERASAGEGALAMEPHLEALAQAHCVHMVQRGFFSHTNPEGLGHAARLEAIDPAPGSSGSAENIAYGASTAAEVMNLWMNSSDHRDNILESRWTHCGVGCYSGGGGTVYWTVVFYRPDGNPATHSWIEPGDTP